MKNVEQPGFEEWNLSRFEFRDFICIDIDAENLMSKFGHAGRMSSAKVSGSENSTTHGHFILLPSKHSAYLSIVEGELSVYISSYPGPAQLKPQERSYTKTRDRTLVASIPGLVRVSISRVSK